MKKGIKLVLALLILGAIVVGGVWLDYYIWSLKHPQAPFWTYLF